MWKNELTIRSIARHQKPDSGRDGRVARTGGRSRSRDAAPRSAQRYRAAGRLLSGLLACPRGLFGPAPKKKRFLAIFAEAIPVTYRRTTVSVEILAELAGTMLRQKLLFRLPPRAEPLLLELWCLQNAHNEIAPGAGKSIPDKLFCLNKVRVRKLAINISGYFFDLCQRRRRRSSYMSLRKLPLSLRN